ncbi:MAG: hypothetical protein IKU23_07165 [Clostridia bacterium]|nr:hypothetical protein [Clostridia bacterium]
MKKLTTLILLLTVILSACAINKPNTEVGNDIYSGTSQEENGNDIYSYGGTFLNVSDRLSEYTFDIRGPEFEMQPASTAMFSFITLENKDGTAKLKILNQQETVVEISYGAVLYDEEENCTGFTVTDETLGDMAFKKDDNGRWIFESENKLTKVRIYNGKKLNPSANYESWGEIEVSFDFIANSDYRCEITYPNGYKTVKKVLCDESNKDYYFEGTKPELNFDRIKAGYLSKSNYRYNFELIGKDKYGYGIMSTNLPITSFTDSSVTVENINETINYESLVWDEAKTSGTVVVNGENYTVEFHKADGLVYEQEEYHLLYNGVSSGQYISVRYYPDENLIRVTAAFSWDADGDIYTITYPNGINTVKRLVQKESGSYGFEDYKA